MNWYKKASMGNEWTPEELDFLVEASQELNNRASDRIQIDTNEVNSDYIHLKVTIKNSISGAFEPQQEVYTREMRIEKTQPNWYEVNVDDSGYNSTQSFKIVSDVVSNFISEIR